MAANRVVKPVYAALMFIGPLLAGIAAMGRSYTKRYIAAEMRFLSETCLIGLGSMGCQHTGCCDGGACE